MAIAPATPGTALRDIVDYELLFDCVHCGLCLEACPTYIVTRAEMDSPRGRIYLMKALAEGRLELDADAVRHLDLCLGCRGCETACPSGVHYGRLIEKARAYVEREYRRNWVERLKRAMVGWLFPYPSRMRAVLAPLWLLERVRMRQVFARMLPPALREWLELLPPLVNQQTRGTTQAASNAAAEAPTVIVHHGCVAQVLSPAENSDSEILLARAGYRVARLERTVCCGALDLHAGNYARAIKFARENVRMLSRSGARAIVSAAAGCSVVMAEYGELLRDDPAVAADAHTVANSVTDLSSLLLQRDLRPSREFSAKVTYHDACHLAHGLGVREAPRALLRSIPAVELVEMAESDVCCGSAGSYNLTEPAMARELARRKADNIIATGADYVVLANPGCEFQIAAELRRRGAKTRVMHLANFVAMVAGES
jgi:glycolate oxidase iron-sulfur subunit